MVAEGSHARSLDYSVEEDAVTIAFSRGELVAIYGVSGPVAPGGSPIVEVVGSFDSGLLCAAWAPDGEFLALLTGAGMAVFLTKGWEIVAEHAVGPGAGAAGGAVTWRPDGRFVAASVNLPEGCRAQVFDRSTFAPAHRVEALVAAPGALVAAWQPNGRHLYIAGSAPEDALTSLRTRTAAGLASARAVGGDGGTEDGAGTTSDGGPARSGDAFVPSAAPRITLVETNGLLHGEVDLRTARPGRIEQLAWSPCSEALAVALRRADGTRALQVWGRSNWHWYLRHERSFGPEEGALFVSWDPEQSLRLQIVTGAGLVSILDLFCDILMSSGGTVAVLDRACIRVTALGAAVVPPPLCHTRLTLDPDTEESGFQAAAIRDYDAGTGLPECVAAVSSGGRVLLGACPEEDLWEEAQGERGADPYDASPAQALVPLTLADGAWALDAIALGGRCVKQIAWSGPLALALLLGPSEAAGEDAVLELSLSLAAGEWMETGRRLLPLPGQVLRIATGINGALLMESSGSVLELSGGQPLREVLRLPAPCRILRPVAPARGQQGTADHRLPLAALSDAGHLFLGPLLVATDATSVAVRQGGAGGPFLCFVNRVHQLRSAPLAALLDRKHTTDTLPIYPPAAKIVSASAGVPWTEVHANVQEAMRVAMRPDAAAAPGTATARHQPPPRDTSLRPVEQGAALVVAPPEGVQVVLQMPRGNLEGVAPRALVLAGAVEALQAGDWAAAWELSTVHRLDLNLLVDFQWPRFLAQAGSFVAALSHAPSEIGDFIFALTVDNTVAPEGLYGSHPNVARGISTRPTATAIEDEGDDAEEDDVEEPTVSGSASGLDLPFDQKVTGVCRALREAMLATQDPRFTLPVLDTYLRSQPPLLGEALRTVKALKEAEVGGAAARGAPSAEAAIRHLLIHVDVDRLYRAALQLYDLPVAYMVIASSQRDPAEYLQELKGFAAMEPEANRRYAIDLSMAQYGSALRHLFEFVESGHPAARFETLVELASTQGLLREALELYGAPGKDARRRQVLDAYGAHLEGRLMMVDAAMAFMAAGSLPAALRCYVAAGVWQMAMVTAGKLGYDAAALRTLAKDVIAQLLQLGQLEAAGQVSLQYLQDADNGVAYLSGAGEWQEALRCAHMCGRPDLVPTVIEPAVAEQSASLLEDVRGNRERIAKYIARWKEVRRRRQELAAALAQAEVDEGAFSRAVDPVDREDAQSEAFSNVTGLSIYTTGTGAGGGGSSIASTLQAPSTIGGRGKKRADKKQKKKNKIQAGSANEELHLVQHIRSLAPLERHLTAAGRICEALVLLGHEADARTLQLQVTRYIDEFQAADAALRADAQSEMRNLSAGPGPAPAGGVQNAAQQLGPLSPALQLAATPGPTIPPVSWKWDILRTTKSTS